MAEGLEVSDWPIAFNSVQIRGAFDVVKRARLFRAGCSRQFRPLAPVSTDPSGAAALIPVSMGRSTHT